MKYLLDLVVNDGEIYGVEESPKPVWAQMKVDGLAKSFHTNRVELSCRPCFNTSARLILELDDLSNSYMYINLCTYSDDNSQVISIAVSKVKLSAFPVGNPRRFKIPLMSTENTAIKCGAISITATISAFLAQYSTQPNYTNPMYQNMYGSSPY